MSIEQFTGVQPKLFRPPGGRVSVRSILVPQILGLKTITWSVDVQDWKCRTELEAEQAADKIIKFTKSEDIILLHDDNPHIIKILDFILPAFREQEFNLYSGLNFI
jgi:peptidoglycan/xylan/chitin deacetylase (PgdA/CDA1 family)